MVIERALEKLRQQAGAKVGSGTAAYAPAAPGAAYAPPAAGTKYAPPASTAARTSPKPLLPPPVPAGPPRQTLPQVECDRSAMIAHRILGPNTALAADERAAAAYRMIRTRLLHRVRGNNLQSIAITSPEAGEGKSVTAINLALSLARDPTSNVVLLDLDMRNPSVCRYLGIKPPHELVSYFTGDVSANDVLFSIGPENLALAGSLASTDLASELLGSGRLEALQQYIASVIPNPVILLDLPPVLVTDEALLVAPRVDATLLVVAEGQTRRDALVRARTVLADFNLVGVLLNRSTESTGASGYYYHYQ